MPTQMPATDERWPTLEDLHLKLEGVYALAVKQGSTDSAEAASSLQDKVHILNGSQRLSDLRDAFDALSDEAQQYFNQCECGYHDRFASGLVAAPTTIEDYVIDLLRLVDHAAAGPDEDGATFLGGGPLANREPTFIPEDD